MVLHVVADVERDVVPRSVVRVGLVASVKHVVLGDKVCGHGVKSHAEDGPGNKVHESLHPDEVVDAHVERKLSHVV